MITIHPSGSKPTLLPVAGAKGAVGFTVTVAVEALRQRPETILPNLTTAVFFPFLKPLHSITFAGWDIPSRSLVESIQYHKVLPNDTWHPYIRDLNQIQLFKAPSSDLSLCDQAERLTNDNSKFHAQLCGDSCSNK